MTMRVGLLHMSEPVLFFLAGVIDEDYRGNVGVILYNHSDQDFVVNPGDRVAQLICEKISYPQIVELEVIYMTKGATQGRGYKL